MNVSGPHVDRNQKLTNLSGQNGILGVEMHSLGGGGVGDGGHWKLKKQLGISGYNRGLTSFAGKPRIVVFG